jgi:hypothetical protein
VVLQIRNPDRGSQGDRLGNGGIEVADLKVKVHHRALFAADRRPNGRLVAGRLLSHARSLSHGLSHVQGRSLISHGADVSG